MHLPLDHEAAYAAVAGRDPRWDGRLYLGVLSTGIYCRPSCPARTPRPENCQFFPTAAAAVATGFRACRRCRPDALPGSRHWDLQGDLVGRAVRLIADGALDDPAGVAGLARTLAVSPRHLHRLLVTQVGASPAQLGRTRRAHTARLLLEQTTLPLTEVAFAAGFGSIRQFNDVMRTEFGANPRAFRVAARPGTGSPTGSPASSSTASPASSSASSSVTTHVSTHTGTGDRAEGISTPTVTLRLAYRPPLELGPLRRTLAAHAIAGVERVGPAGRHTRVVDAPGGPAVVHLDLSEPAPSGRPRTDPRNVTPAALPPGDRPGARSGPQRGDLTVTLRLTSLGDLMPVVARLRRWLDLDADPAQVAAHLAPDPMIGPLLHQHPGLRVPGAVDGAELAVCAVLGQQVSLAVARTFQSRIAAAFGTPLPASLASPPDAPGTPPAEPPPPGGASKPAATSEPVTPALRTFPRPEVLAAAGPQQIRDAANLTQARARTVHLLASALAAGEIDLTPGADPSATRSQLLALPGIGPWTADYLALRVLRDPDAFMPSDLVARKALAAQTGLPLAEVTPAVAHALSEAWRPWRSYALQHLWTIAAYR